MKWPRGRANGQRIVGVEWKLRVDLTRWRLVFDWPSYQGPVIALGPVIVWLSWEYKRE